jgi:hypothetical protein
MVSGGAPDNFDWRQCTDQLGPNAAAPTEKRWQLRSALQVNMVCLVNVNINVYIL